MNIGSWVLSLEYDEIGVLINVIEDEAEVDSLKYGLSEDIIYCSCSKIRLATEEEVETAIIKGRAIQTIYTDDSISN